MTTRTNYLAGRRAIQANLDGRPNQAARPQTESQRDSVSYCHTSSDRTLALHLASPLQLSKIDEVTSSVSLRLSNDPYDTSKNHSEMRGVTSPCQHRGSVYLIMTILSLDSAATLGDDTHQTITMKSGRIDCKCQPDANKNHPDCLEIGERVVVRCNNYRCVAYCDRDGLWRLERNNEVLADEPLEVIFRFRSIGPMSRVKPVS